MSNQLLPIIIICINAHYYNPFFFLMHHESHRIYFLLNLIPSLLQNGTYIESNNYPNIATSVTHGQDCSYTVNKVSDGKWHIFNQFYFAIIISNVMSRYRCTPALKTYFYICRYMSGKIGFYWCCPIWTSHGNWRLLCYGYVSCSWRSRHRLSWLFYHNKMCQSS